MTICCLCRKDKLEDKFTYPKFIFEAGLDIAYCDDCMELMLIEATGYGFPMAEENEDG